ncbi:MAG: hypothetical protein WCF03_08285 [Nitrososphaeraceae archaeon]
MASDCFPFIHIENVPLELPLCWKQYIQEPKECITHATIPDNETPRNEYNRLLGYHYVQDLLQQCGVKNIDIQVNKTHKLYLFFTFEGSDFAYLMIPLDNAHWYGKREVFYNSVYGVFLFIQMSVKRELRIRLKSSEHNERGEHKFKIKFNSWDNVELNTV